MVREDFCATILTHGRADRVITQNSLRRHGYTGPIYYVLDDEDAAYGDYVQRFGEEAIWVFSKKEYSETVDVGDNYPNRRGVVYARNAVFDLVREAGYKYFFMLDDDYQQFSHRFDDEAKYGTWPIKTLDAVLEAFVEYLEATPFTP